MQSGLYDKLVHDDSLLIPHEEVILPELVGDECDRIIKPLIIPFISYPYEWCFGALKDAGLATLSIQKKALEYGMSLKDCSAYNIQFLEGKPRLIDTLSFETYQEGSPWIAYRQFCQHFLAPLALMSFRDERLSQLLRIHMDGIPLDLAAQLLPWRARLKGGLLFHIFFHAKSQKHFQQRPHSSKEQSISRRGLLGLIENLESTIHRLKWRKVQSPWTSYYDDDSYSSDAFENKRQLVSEYLELLKPKMVWDFGGNTGAFSKIVGTKDRNAILFDNDVSTIELAYQNVRSKGAPYLLPLQSDLTNPSSSIGWAHKERMSLSERGPADTVMALALVHHLAISNNIPLSAIAHFFATISRSIIVEFIPKNDPKVQLLFSTREDIFPHYTLEEFEKAFESFFVIARKDCVNDSERILYAMRKKT